MLSEPSGESAKTKHIVVADKVENCKGGYELELKASMIAFLHLSKKAV